MYKPCIHPDEYNLSSPKATLIPIRLEKVYSSAFGAG